MREENYESFCCLEPINFTHGIRINTIFCHMKWNAKNAPRIMWPDELVSKVNDAWHKSVLAPCFFFHFGCMNESDADADAMYSKCVTCI